MASAATSQWGKEVPLEMGMGGRRERGGGGEGRSMMHPIQRGGGERERVRGEKGGVRGERERRGV